MAKNTAGKMSNRKMLGFGGKGGARGGASKAGLARGTIGLSGRRSTPLAAGFGFKGRGGAMQMHLARTPKRGRSGR
jgi:hypothetical protein